MLDKNESIENYALLFSKEEDVLLKKINRETHIKVNMPQMLSGHLQGLVLEFISKMIQPQNILEIGTFTAYSAICLAKGLKENGRLTTIEINPELEMMIQQSIEESGMQKKIDLKIGNAMEIIPNLNSTFDLVFIDADKINYTNYFNLVIEKVSIGGYILADNVLWSGKILDEKKDKTTQAIHDFNEMIKNDSRVENYILPLRDGVNIIRKIK